MTPDALLEFCLGLPQAIETFPFGPETSAFKTSGNGRIFALSALAGEPFSVSLKCDPEDSRALRKEFPGQITPGYHLNKKHWITIVLGDGGVDDELVEQLLRDSHELVRPTMPRARLTDPAASEPVASAVPSASTATAPASGPARCGSRGES